MRVTIRLDPEGAAAAERLSSDRHISLGEAVNELARAGLAHQQKAARFQQRTASVGVSVDVTSAAGALELLETQDTR